MLACVDPLSLPNAVQVGQKYHVLCVLTDGIINDMVGPFARAWGLVSQMVRIFVFFFCQSCAVAAGGALRAMVLF